MTDVTQILSQIDQGNPNAAEQLLPVVYDELRQLAAARLANEKPGQTLQATALVHEAYLRLVGGEQEQHWRHGEEAIQGTDHSDCKVPTSESYVDLEASVEEHTLDNPKLAIE